MAEDQNLDEVEAVDSGVPEWVPEKFREHPEKFAEAYTNLEREYHSSRQELKGLEEAVQSLTTQQEQFFTQQNQPDPQSIYAQWQEAFDADPIGTITAIANSTAQQVHKEYADKAQSQPGIKPEDYAAREGVRAMEATYEDWGSYKEKVGEIVKSDPLFANDAIWVSPDLTTRALDRAYQLAKAQDVLSGNTVVQQQLNDTRNMKLQAQTASGAGGRLPAEDDSKKRWEEIANAESGKLGL